MKLNTTKAPLAPVKPVSLTPQKEKTTAILAGWIVLGLGFILAMVPGLGLSMVVLSIPVCLASGLLGIIGAAKGKPMRGVLLIVVSIVSFGVFLILPWLTSAIGAAMMPKQ